MSMRTAQKRTRKSRTLRSLSLMSMRKRMSWQRQERCWMSDSRRRQEQKRQEREEVYAALQYAASFRCVVEEWKNCEELKPQRKEKWTFVGKKGEETRHGTEWSAAVSTYRCMRCGRGKQVHEHARDMHRAEILGKKSWENGGSNRWEDTIW